MILPNIKAICQLVLPQCLNHPMSLVIYTQRLSPKRTVFTYTLCKIKASKNPLYLNIRCTPSPKTISHPNTLNMSSSNNTSLPHPTWSPLSRYPTTTTTVRCLPPSFLSVRTALLAQRPSQSSLCATGALIAYTQLSSKGITMDSSTWQTPTLLWWATPYRCRP